MFGRGMAAHDSNPGNFLDRIQKLEEKLADIERWAAPIGAVFLPNPPGLEAWRTTGLTIPDITHTTVDYPDFISEQGLEMEGSSIIKLRRDSAVEWYDINALVSFDNHVSNNRVVRFQVRNINTGSWTGIDPYILPAAQNGLDTNFVVSYRYVMRATDDAVRFQVYQDTGGNLTLNLFLLNVLLVKSGDVVAP